MKSLATLLLIAFLVASLAHGQSVRVATYNLNWGNRSGDQVLDAITAAKADILCLQETTVQSVQFLNRHLAGRYPEFHSVGHNGQYAAERFVIASTIRPPFPEAGLGVTAVMWQEAQDWIVRGLETTNPTRHRQADP